MPMRLINLLAMTVVLVGCQSATDSETLAIVNARVYTLAWGEPATDGTPAANAPWDGNTWRPDAEAILVRDGKIAFVGSSEEVRARAGPDARTVDLAGATVLPGLVDSHTHVTEMGRHEGQVSLLGSADENEAVARVAAFAGGVPKGRWIIGYGWDEGAWANVYPTLDALTAAVPDHPVVLTSLHGFAVWGNRLALAAAGIDRDAQATSGGEILRDANGDPTGVLLNRATPMLTGAIPPDVFPPLEHQLEAALLTMARAGFVAVHEAGLTTELLAAFERLDEQGRLPIRVYAMVSARDADLMRRWIARGPRADPTGRLEIRAVKAYYDGALGSRGARLLHDYADCPGHRGVAGGEYGFDEALVSEAARAGFQVAVHAIGDAGNREVLRFFEQVIATAPATRTLRHRIEHAQVVPPDDFPRFARSAIIASMQPPHAVEDMPWAEDRLGKDRVRGAYAWRTLRRTGVRLALNSDLPGSNHDPFYGLHAAVTRRNQAKQPPGGWYPDQRLTPEEAVRGYTTWAAYAGFSDHVRGRIAPGFLADLTVIDLDPFVAGTKDPGRLLDGKVLMTMVEGRVVYGAPPAQGR
ncbi:MAG: hypothetical protein CMJ83_17050 [Planctomycetes bacterium]|nr:hypothetical protein [Planctomycetota bacterium]